MSALDHESVVAAMPAVSSGISLPQLPYRDGVVYGPIQSRRVGWSLGINLLGQEHRVCTFDCTYCQFPRPRRQARVGSDSGQLLRGDALMKEIRQGIEARIATGVRFDSLSFVGNGDPSVHPDLLEAARTARAVLKRLRPTAVMSIFTNAVPYRSDSFLDALREFDKKLIKLDAGDDVVFRQINRSQVSVHVEDLVDRLALVGGVTIQTMVVHGTTDNRDSIRQPAFGRLVERARAVEVQLATIDKRPAFKGVLPVPEEELHSIAHDIRQHTTVPVQVYFQDCPSGFPGCMPPRATEDGVGHT